MLNLDFLLCVICRQNFKFTCKNAHYFILITSTSILNSFVLIHSLAISIGRVVRIKDPISEKALIYRQALLT